ncbi:MAG: alginate lyase family protein [Prevotellaceae bacterium]|jgi:hypothetical protein|nr:alginate lyase family protein [Prevotellaceae bacterium]
MKMTHLMAMLSLLAGSAVAACASSAMHPDKQLEFVKTQIEAQREPVYSAYLQLIRYADSALSKPQHALADFAVPGFYDKPHEHRATSLAIQQDAFAAYAAALAYALSGEEKYGAKAAYILNAWSRVNKKYSEHDGVLVMTYSGAGLMIAAELMKDAALWSESDKNEFRKWVAGVYQKAANEIRATPHVNNWADWGRFGSLLAASFLDDSAEVAENVRLIKTTLFEKIAPDSSLPDETKRGGNGIWYTYFSLAPMTAACWVAYNLTDENLFALEQNGVSIKAALDYLAYYTDHPAAWRWSSNPNTPRQKEEPWTYNLLEAMSGLYGDQRYAGQVGGKRPLIYPRHHFAWTFPTLMPLNLNFRK